MGSGEASEMWLSRCNFTLRVSLLNSVTLAKRVIYTLFLLYFCNMDYGFLRRHCLPCLLWGNAPEAILFIQYKSVKSWQHAKIWGHFWKIVHINVVIRNPWCSIWTFLCVFSGQHAPWPLGSDIWTHHSVSFHRWKMKVLVCLSNIFQCELIFDWSFCLFISNQPSPEPVGHRDRDIRPCSVPVCASLWNEVPWPLRVLNHDFSPCLYHTDSTLTCDHWPLSHFKRPHAWSCDL